MSFFLNRVDVLVHHSRELLVTAEGTNREEFCWGWVYNWG